MCFCFGDKSDSVFNVTLCPHCKRKTCVVHSSHRLPRKPIWMCISNVWMYRNDFCMFLEDVYILTWETDVNIKEKGCVSPKLKVCEKCLKWSQNCSGNPWWGTPGLFFSSVPFTFHSGDWIHLTSHVFLPWPRYCLLSKGIVRAPGFAEAGLPGRRFMTLRYQFPLKWRI